MSNVSDLHRLADAFGVATTWTGHGARTVEVSDATLTTVLGALGALAGDEDPAAALRRRASDLAGRIIAPTTVVRPAQRHVDVRVPDGAEVILGTEDGATQHLPVADNGSAVRLPVDLELGYHELVVTDGSRILARAHLIAVPDRAPMPDRGWGWMLQLYALRSADSWGVGDISDLRRLLAWSAEQGADFIVSNPLHAAAPTLPQEPSPYYPSSRRYWNPSYLRPEDIPEYATAPADVRQRTQQLAGERRVDNTSDRIDRDAMWLGKRGALELLWRTEHTPARREAFAAFRAREGEPLRQFALWCAVADAHGTDWRSWPEALRHPSTAGPADTDPDRVAFHEWLQFLTDEQLAAAQVTAVAAGMSLGIIHDLAVGVNPNGADGWALQDHLASGVTVGAPPDDFNQQGQDWAQPPLLPHTLTESGYAVIRDLVRRLLRHSGGIRIDHILGYFRLFWVPGGDPQAGTYVTYPADDLLGILALEATRAGAVVIGEDLGVVAPGVREAMRDRQLLGSRLMYFTYDAHGDRLPADAYERQALASITTHDLPTAAGWWDDEGVRTQVQLGLLADDVSPEDEFDRKRRERDSMRALLQAHGLLHADTDPVVAMHAFLGRCASVLVAGSLPDAVGDIRQPNMPGTVDEYPNWRLPAATVVDGAPEPITIEALFTHPQVRRTIDALSTTREKPRGD